MSLHEDVKGCRIVVRDVTTGKTIADSDILSCDVESGKIEVGTDRIVLPKGREISALVFGKSGLFESRGYVGTKTGKKTQLFLDSGTEKNDRQAVRYQVNIHGTAETITTPAGEKREGGFELLIFNMSEIGLLLQVPAGKIHPGDIIRFSAVSKGRCITITAEANRVEEQHGGKERVGCAIQLVNLG